MSVGNILLATQAIAMGAQVFAGVEAQKASDAEASFQRQQAALQATEANEEAERLEKEAESFRKRQKIMFLKSGVAIEGSPLLILEETRAEAEKQADAVRNRGQAQFNLGLQRAKITSNKGRSALFGSTVKSVASFGSSFATGREKGLF